VTAALVVLGAGALVASRAASRSQAVDSGSSSTRTRFIEAFVAVCESGRQARSSVPTARSTFYGRAHSTLHEIAQQTEAKDRPAAASLLEAMSAVEGQLAFGVPATAAPAFDRLIDATKQALRSMGVHQQCPSPKRPK
jgi:hypothetical protein